MNDSTERFEVGAALGKCCKCGPSQCLNIAFLALEKANFKGCDGEN